MKVGVLADIHGNVIALRNCINFLKDQGCEEYIFLGDYISDAPYPLETLDYLYEFVAKHSCHILRGNREEYMLAQKRALEVGDTDALWSRNSASGNLLFNYELLRDRDFVFFDSLPISFVYHKDGYPAITCCHGSPVNSRELVQFYRDNSREWLEKIGTDYMLCGHTHHPGELEYKGKHYFNPGSVGIAIDNPGIAECLMLESVTNDKAVSWKAHFFRIPYDNKKLIEDIKSCGLLDYSTWFVNSNLLTFETGRDLSYDMVIEANRLAKEMGDYVWPNIPEECFEQAARTMGVPDYRQ